MPGFFSLRDVETVEAVEGHGLPLDPPQNIYGMIHCGANLNPQVSVLSFFLGVNDHHTSQTWSYIVFLERITQTANSFDGIGVKRDSVIALALPNLPETHFVIWGGRAIGIVTTFSPLLERPVLAEPFNAADASVPVTLALPPGIDTRIKPQPHLSAIKSLWHLVLVNLADHVYSVTQCVVQMQKNEALRLFSP